MIELLNTRSHLKNTCSLGSLRAQTAMQGRPRFRMAKPQYFTKWIDCANL
jgi:hypothetical protein